jgi:hypothetical protein
VPIKAAIDPGAAFLWHFFADISLHEEIMRPTNIRLPAAMIAALRLQAEARGLDFSAHVRSQLAAILICPADITKTAERSAR